MNKNIYICNLCDKKYQEDKAQKLNLKCSKKDCLGMLSLMFTSTLKINTPISEISIDKKNTTKNNDSFQTDLNESEVDSEYSHSNLIYYLDLEKHLIEIGYSKSEAKKIIEDYLKKNNLSFIDKTFGLKEFQEFKNTIKPKNLIQKTTKTSFKNETKKDVKQNIIKKELSDSSNLEKTFLNKNNEFDDRQLDSLINEIFFSYHESDKNRIKLEIRKQNISKSEYKKTLLLVRKNLESKKEIKLETNNVSLNDFIRVTSSKGLNKVQSIPLIKRFLKRKKYNSELNKNLKDNQIPKNLFDTFKQEAESLVSTYKNENNITAHHLKFDNFIKKACGSSNESDKILNHFLKGKRVMFINPTRNYPYSYYEELTTNWNKIFSQYKQHRKYIYRKKVSNTLKWLIPLILISFFLLVKNCGEKELATKEVEINYKNGDRYIGIINNGVFEGFGEYYFNRGDRYRGNWSNGKFNGYGEYFYIGGEIYKGNWESGRKSGYGEYFFKNGDIYRGKWLNDLQNGNGKYYQSSTKKTQNNNWNNGKIITNYKDKKTNSIETKNIDAKTGIDLAKINIEPCSYEFKPFKLGDDTIEIFYMKEFFNMNRSTSLNIKSGVDSPGNEGSRASLQTINAVKRFQNSMGFPVNGEIDNGTKYALENLCYQREKEKALIKHNIIGVWNIKENNGTRQYLFKKDGTGILNNSYKKFTWKINRYRVIDISYIDSNYGESKIIINNTKNRIIWRAPFEKKPKTAIRVL